MGRNDLCSPSLCIRESRPLLSDSLFIRMYHHLKEKITRVKERILSKLPKGRREKKAWLARQPRLFLEGGREERLSNPDWSHDENPIQYEERAPVGEPRRIVSKDNRVWTVTQGERLMTK
ncbi:hypothetical protein CEP52_009571 [Fusarium oligoseptatum]|uniref:Uncharacterized protein n=1 Tax=Fusarium oligoseptatum TaxID=2604345 RepID=A0A428TCG1_9HYPO|nr:hypothetical protein CEP52_009571 [Fusarium oligoseptatum]